MRILHITASLRGGGVQNFLLSLLPEQLKQGHEVSLIVIEKYDYDYCKHLDHVLQNHGVNVVCLNKIRHNKISMFKTLFLCRKYVKELKPDIVNTHIGLGHFYGAVSVIGRNIKHVLTVHNAPERWSFYVKLLCSGSPLIFCSQSAYDMRLQNSNKMCAINNGVCRDIVHTDNVVNLRTELGLKSTDKVILLVGSLRPQKNYVFLKEIVDKINDSSLHFCICGGNYGVGYVSIDEFKEYPNIHCLGLRSDVSAIENTADLFLSCSTFEGLPIAVLEAYFNGVPCVLSPIPQHKDIAEVYKVYLPDSFDVMSFIEKIKMALAEYEEHDAIYEKRKSQIEQYSISHACRKYIEFYQDALDEK